VPAGGTNSYWPRDHCIFGELKPQQMAEITKHMAIRGAVNIDCDQSLNTLVRCCNAISGENIRKVWALPSLAEAMVSE
jgi:hypothetical protein